MGNVFVEGDGEDYNGGWMGRKGYIMYKYLYKTI